jgi:hypothetical protein
MKQIKDTISGPKLGNPTTNPNMTIFPLFGHGITPDYLTLDEALVQKRAKITEVSEGGSVPELGFVNESDMPVFLMDGKELIVAKQNPPTWIGFGQRRDPRIVPTAEPLRFWL